MMMKEEKNHDFLKLNPSFSFHKDLFLFFFFFFFFLFFLSSSFSFLHNHFSSCSHCPSFKMIILINWCSFQRTRTHQISFFIISFLAIVVWVWLDFALKGPFPLIFNSSPSSFVDRSFDCTAPFFVWRNISLAFLKYVWAQAGKIGAAEGEAEGGPRPRQDQGVRGKQDVRGFFSSLSLLFSYFSSFSFFFPCITFYFFLFFPLLCLPVCSYLFFSLSSSSFVLSSYTEYCSKTADPFIHNGLVDVGANPFTKSTRSGGCTIL